MVTRESKTTSKIAIPKIRPASWRVYVQGEQEAQFVRRVLGEAGIEVTEPEGEPGLTDPPLYAVVANAAGRRGFDAGRAGGDPGPGGEAGNRVRGVVTRNGRAVQPT